MKGLEQGIEVPEIRSSVAQLLEHVDHPGHKLTLVALLTFYRRRSEEMSHETGGNILKSRLIWSGVLYFGSMYDAKSEATRGQRITSLANAGFCTEPLVFLNVEQVELFHAYVCETGLVASL